MAEQDSSDKRGDAVRKVRGLMAKAAEGSGVTPEERESLVAKATELRFRHGISDAEVALPRAEEELRLFGVRLGWYQRTVGSHVQRAQEAIHAAIAAAKTGEDEQERMEALCHLYKDLQGAVDGTGYNYDPVKGHRDAAVKAYYLAEKKHYAEQMKTWCSSDSTYQEDSVHLHDHALTYTAMHSDLRRDHVERIVGVTHKKLHEKSLREAVCDICGLDGNGGREVAWFVGGDTERYQHESCHEKEASVAT